jgi:hypothetical protein
VGSSVEEPEGPVDSDASSADDAAVPQPALSSAGAAGAMSQAAHFDPARIARAMSQAAQFDPARIARAMSQAAQFDPARIARAMSQAAQFDADAMRAAWEDASRWSADETARALELVAEADTSEIPLASSTFRARRVLRVTVRALLILLAAGLIESSEQLQSASSFLGLCYFLLGVLHALEDEEDS